jgi:hypothetical protein
MRKPAVAKAIKMGLLISFLGLFILSLWHGVEPSLAKRKPLSPVDSMFQEMESRPFNPPAQDLSSIAEKYIKIESSKEDVVAFFSQSKNRLKVTEYTPKESGDLRMGFVLERNNWVCNSSYTVDLALQDDKVKDIHARYGAACL